ncbi:DUF805 domain-containing protein [Meridianimarinicoccus roseus]|uniref:DUF805 domain-containing protein n=1 Tax=Meridianimarinicoccus roseus TaxID=2072018 RepID=A0A2V2LGG2_9RHOB|nr:DUF805 domain-containing protein [Meridianimarinicoccus roseus]PWR02277.1 DUF805 domain-containing protein [Meridianimarinicoccus roseus]
MTFGDAIRKCFSDYATFTGRAPRPEFWWFFLFGMLGKVAFSILDTAVFAADTAGRQVGVFGALFSLAVLLPTIAVGVRRLHDLDKSGWWYLLILIPVLGGLVLLYFFAQKGSVGDNRFGPPAAPPEAPPI